ncbi:MAG: hypothetical protein QW726_05980 [Fervidicoccaceae archaeon]
MSLIAIVNTKGGSGKTTLAQHFILPALEQAVFIDTDVYNRSISDIKNSKHLIKGIKLQSVKPVKGYGKAIANPEEMLDEVIQILDEYKGQYVIMDSGAGGVADAVLNVALALLRHDLVKMFFVPIREDSFNTSATINYIKQRTDRYVPVDIINRSGSQIYIPEIGIGSLNLVKKFAITLPEILDLQPDQLDIRERGMQGIYKEVYSEEVDSIIKTIRGILQ